MNDIEILEIDRELHVTACADIFASAFAAEPWEETWPEVKARQRIAEILTCPNSIGLVAAVGGEHLGFLAGYIESFHPSDRFQLAEMAVRPEHQRCGIGAALVGALNDCLAAKNVGEVFLITARGESSEDFWSAQSFGRSTGRVVMVSRRFQRDR